MDTHEHALDIFGDEERPPLIVDAGDHSVVGKHNGSICVHAGSSIAVLGTLNGSLALRPGSSATITGTHNGSLHVSDDSTVEIHGAKNGSVHVDVRGRVHVRPGGKLAGSLHVDGLIENEGVRGGPVSGCGAVREVGAGSVKEPTIENGANVYRW